MLRGAGNKLNIPGFEDASRERIYDRSGRKVDRPT